MTPQSVMDMHAKSFAWAARFLAPEAKLDAAQLYVFARIADDLADEEELGPLDARMLELQRLENNVLSPTSGDELGHKVGHLMQAKGVDSDVVRQFMLCLRQDARQYTVQTTEELLHFAYGVAGTVGQMMCPILGAPHHAQRYAVALGVGMQLTNIARDVVEDAQRGRCYIPAQWGASIATLSAPSGEQHIQHSFALIKKLLSLADDFYAYGQTGFQYIPANNRRAIRIATTLYRAIGQKILKNGAHAYWRGRTSLGRMEKTKLLMSCYCGDDALSKHVVRDVIALDMKHMAAVSGFPLAGA
jgi:phytoene synthase